MVCSITRGPANPISAPGSAILMSPSIAKLAVTPPVVGSVSSEIYGTFASSSRANAAETFASCIRLIVPSIMRAPPEQEITIRGWRVSMANSTPRVTFSPTTAPIEPPMKLNSIAQTTTGRPASCPSAVITASFMPSFLRASLRRVAYGFVSTNCRGSVDVIPASCSVQRPSSSISKRCFAFILKWKPHFGQTRRFASRSLRKTMVPQDSHFTHRPSVRTLRSSGGVACSIDFFSRLNQAIVRSGHYKHRCWTSMTGSGQQNRDSRQFQKKGRTRAKAADQLRLIVYTTLGQNALCVRVFDLFHLGHEVGHLHQFGMSVPAGADHVYVLGASAQAFDDVVCAAVDRVAPCGPALVRHLDVFGVGLGAPDFDEAAAHRTDFEFIVAEHFGGIEFAVMPRTFDELDHENSQALTDGSERGAERARRLALAWTGVDDQKSFVLRHT